MKTITHSIFLSAILTTFALQVNAQELTNRKFRLEIEPAAFVLKGVSGSVLYRVSNSHDFSLGLFGASVDVPEFTRKSMFENLESDVTGIRLGFQLALMARYKLNLFKEMESNPYIGFIGGWEYFDIKTPSYADKIRLTTFVITPYLGYEIYFFKQMLYLNPQLRGVIYVGAESDAPTRPEKLAPFLLLPQLSIGIRL